MAGPPRRRRDEDMSLFLFCTWVLRELHSVLTVSTMPWTDFRRVSNTERRAGDHGLRLGDWALISARAMLAAPSGTDVQPGAPGTHGRRDIGGNRATPSRAWILGGFALSCWSQTCSGTRSIGTRLLQRARTSIISGTGSWARAPCYRSSQWFIRIASFCSSCGDQRPTCANAPLPKGQPCDALHLNTTTSPVFSCCATASLLRHWEYGVVLERNLGPVAVQTGTPN